MIEPYHEGMSFNVEFPIRGTRRIRLALGANLFSIIVL